MSEWELRVNQKEMHRMHVVRLTIKEGNGRPRSKALGNFSTADEAVAAKVQSGFQRSVLQNPLGKAKPPGGP